MFSRPTVMLKILSIIVLNYFLRTNMQYKKKWQLWFLILHYVGPLSFKARTKFRNYLKSFLNCCKSQIVHKSRNKRVFFFQAELSASKIFFFIYTNDSPLNMVQYCFYFILKALFIVNIFKSLF